MSYTNIRSAFAAQLQTLPNLPAVAWENVTFTPVPGAPYFKPSLLMSEPSQAALGDAGENEQRGVYQISIYFPSEGGEKGLYDYIDAIRSHFKRGTRLTHEGQSLTIRNVWPGPLLQETDRLHVPVSIAFYAYTAN